MKHDRKLRGISLIAAVFGELSEHLDEELFTTEELLQSAQTLIEFSKNDYVVDKNLEHRRYANYYSEDVCTAFEKFEQRILFNEYFSDDDCIPRMDCGSMLHSFLNNLPTKTTCRSYYA